MLEKANKPKAGKPRPRRKSGRRFTLARLKSAIDNPTDELRDINPNCAPMRRLRSLIRNHVSDYGGDDQLSTAELVLIRASAMMALQLQMRDRKWMSENGGVASAGDLAEYSRVVNGLRRVYEALGLKRRARELPSLAEYLAAKQRQTDNDTTTINGAAGSA